MDLEAEGFVPARPLRFRPTGCFVRLQGTGAEAWLPVEHMEPRTEAATAAIRELMRGLPGGRLRVRETGEGEVSMLSERAAKAKAAEIDARRRMIEEGIALLRESYDSRKWLSGRVSAVQPTGAYVSVVEGKDALVPLAEMPEKFLTGAGEGKGGEPGAEGARREDSKVNLQVGQSVQFRVVRYAWQSDAFYASMLSYEESVARRNAARGMPPGPGPRSTPAAVRASSIDPSVLRDPAASSSRDRARSIDAPKDSQRWANKGFSIVNSSAADELNAWLRQSTEDKKLTGKAGKAGVKSSDRKFIVNVVRGMNSKVVGQITLPMKASDKEVKDAALSLVTKEGELKAGQDHKGVAIAKNIINVKV